MRTFKIILMIGVIASLAAGHTIFPRLHPKTYDEKSAIKEVAPQAESSSKRQNPPHYLADDGTVVFNSHDIAPSIRGYAGPITVLLALTPNGTISGIRILEHHETKNYVQYMEKPAYLERFIGKGVNDPFEVDKDIDAISRATVSVEALAKTVKESSRVVAASVLKTPVQEHSQKAAVQTGGIMYAVLFCLAFGFYLLSRQRSLTPLIRDSVLVLSILIVGIYLSSPLSVLHMFNLLLLRPSSTALWYAVIISSAVSIAFAGRFYCGWLCPFGALSEFISRLPLKKWQVPAESDDRWRELKYLVLGLAAVIVFSTQRPEFGNYEPYVILFSFNGHYLAWSLTALTLAINIRVPRFWCRYLCPVGAVTGMLSRKDSGYVSRHDCPMGNRPGSRISECIRCNRCYTKNTGGNGSSV